MEFEDYIAKLPGKLSEAKSTILKTLWNAGSGFPRDWVPSSTLLELTGQKYFDRRTRELRDEMGCDIETQPYSGEHCYRLKSSKIEVSHPRFYLSAAQKKDLFIKSNYTCKICGCRVEPGTRGLQADHKIPLIRGGLHQIDNWQTMCNECNVGKRRACQNCDDDCTKCPWAFPERSGSITLVRLSPELLTEFRQQGYVSQKQIETKISETLAEYFTKS